MSTSGIVYVTENLKNRRIYVGIHTKGRKTYLGSGVVLNNAIRKYGRESFKRYDVDRFNSIEEGCTKERFWIREMNSKHPNGYNLCEGGEGVFNPCEEIRDKMSKNNGMKHSEVIARRSGENHHMFGKHHSAETKTKMSAAMIGSPGVPGNLNPMKRPEQRARMIDNKNAFGCQHTEMRGKRGPYKTHRVEISQ